jgi:hypothetical protein
MVSDYAGFKFGMAAGEVPVLGGAAAWLTAYMVDTFGPESVKEGFGAGLAASSIPLGAQAAGELATAAGVGAGSEPLQRRGLALQLPRLEVLPLVLLLPMA